MIPTLLVGPAACAFWKGKTLFKIITEMPCNDAVLCSPLRNKENKLDTSGFLRLDTARKVLEQWYSDGIYTSSIPLTASIFKATSEPGLYGFEYSRLPDYNIGTSSIEDLYSEKIVVTTKNNNFQRSFKPPNDRYHYFYTPDEYTEWKNDPNTKVVEVTGEYLWWTSRAWLIDHCHEPSPPLFPRNATKIEFLK